MVTALFTDEPVAAVSDRRRRWQPPTSNTAPLSNKQKGIVCSVARRAFAKLMADGALAPVPGQSSSVAFEAWRREQQAKACGRASLRAAIQDDYKPLMARFLDLAGDVEAALRYQEEAALEPRNLAMNKLRATCASRGVTMDYANRICRQAWKCDLRDANREQIWFVRRQVQKMEAAGPVPAAPAPAPAFVESKLPF